MLEKQFHLAGELKKKTQNRKWKLCNEVDFLEKGGGIDRYEDRIYNIINMTGHFVDMNRLKKNK